MSGLTFKLSGRRRVRSSEQLGVISCHEESASRPQKGYGQPSLPEKVQVLRRSLSESQARCREIGTKGRRVPERQDCEQDHRQRRCKRDPPEPAVEG